MEWVIIIVALYLGNIVYKKFYKPMTKEAEFFESNNSNNEPKDKVIETKTLSDEEILNETNKAIESVKNNYSGDESYINGLSTIKDNFRKYPKIITIDILKPLLQRNTLGNYETIYKNYNDDIIRFLLGTYTIQKNYKAINVLKNINSDIYISLSKKNLIPLIEYFVKIKDYDTALEWIDDGFIEIDTEYIVQLFNKIICLLDIKQKMRLLEILLLRIGNINSSHILFSLEKDKVLEILKEYQSVNNDYALFYILIKSNEVIQKYDTNIIEENKSEILSLRENNNFKKFNLFIRKLSREGKNVNALYFLIKYGGIGQDSSINSWIANLSKYLLALNYYDLVKDIYIKFDLVKNNFDYIIQLLPYSIENKDKDTAKDIIKFVEKVEPNHKVLVKAKKQLEKLEFKIASSQNGNKELDSLSGIEFEKLLCDKFKELGFFAEMTTGSGDFGADIIVETKNQSKIIVQCKRFKNKVNLKAVQEVLGAVGHFNADVGIVITNNTFLNSAKKLAETNDIELWNENRLKLFLEDDISFSVLSEL